MRMIDWVDGTIRIIDQTRLPAEERVLFLSTIDELAEAISSLRVRGAPALGVAGGLGVALAARRARENGEDVGEAISRATSLLVSTRPTAVNLKWGIERIKKVYDPTRPRTVGEMIEHARDGRRRRRGKPPYRRSGGRPPDRRIPRSDALQRGRFSLRCSRHGFEHRRSCPPARLGSERYGYGDPPPASGISPHRLGAQAYGSSIPGNDRLRRRWPDRFGQYRCHHNGADRIAANGDVANKVGTYPLALAARANGVPFIVAAPSSTIDLETSDGVLSL